MPVVRKSGGYSFGGGIHRTKAGAGRSYRAYLAKKKKRPKKTKSRSIY